MSESNYQLRPPSLYTFLSPILSFFHPTIDALTLPSLPFHIRLRLLAFQPAVLLIYLLNHIPCHLLISYRPATIQIPVRNKRTVRALLYTPPASSQISPPAKRPVHIDLPGGAFISSQPEGNHRFCTYLAQHTGFIVISASYRFAPRHPFPAALEDAQDVVEWVLNHADEFGGDAGRLTVGGSSAGGNLAISISGLEGLRERIRGVVTFYAPIDLTIPPSQKPRPPEMPRFDPATPFLPLFDLYAKSGRDAGYAADARLSPCLARGSQVPKKLLMIIPAIDILVKEQLDFMVRTNREATLKEGKERVEFVLMRKCFHGWLELSSILIDEGSRRRVFEKCGEFLKKVDDIRENE